jgi:NAD(P)H-dependent FMN reductase
MKNVLILTGTKNSNYSLGKNLLDLINQNNYNVNLSSLEDFNLPLFVASDYEVLKQKHLNDIKRITDLLVKSDGLIICSPEYNGSIPPIITNAIAWISVTTEYWRDAFSNKIGLIATSSGGPAINYNTAMKNQLEHLGMVIMPRMISVSSSNPFKKESASKILKQFLNLI